MGRLHPNENMPSPGIDVDGRFPSSQLAEDRRASGDLPMQPADNPVVDGAPFSRLAGEGKTGPAAEMPRRRT